jgi:uncharacterized RDD family membrane protein YckC
VSVIVIVAFFSYLVSSINFVFGNKAGMAPPFLLISLSMIFTYMTFSHLYFFPAFANFKEPSGSKEK